MRKANFFLLMALAMFNHQFVFGQCGGTIDFGTDWFQSGPASAGTWNVSGGGSTVTQTINGLPTYYVSGENYIDVRISGTFRVNTGNDDDMVGFVFGYQDPITPPNGMNHKYYLFDWKQAPQPSNPPEQEGFFLTKVDSTIDLNVSTDVDLFWDHPVGLPGFNVMDSLNGPGTGWSDYTTYDFTLTYTSQKIIIEIDSDTIFDISGCFEPGRFGFYNFSQDQAIYSNFSYELIADFDMSVGETCINSNVDFESVNSFCQSGSYVSPITGWEWDLGDGTIITDTNVTHLYSEPGNYTVQLNVSDDFGCVSTVSQNIQVKGLVADIGQTLICPGSSTDVWCNLADDGALYQWFLDGNPITSPTVNDTLITVNTGGDYHVEITGYDPSYNPCNTVSNTVQLVVENETVTLNGTGGTTICSGASVDLQSTNISGATQYEWFLNGSSQGTGTNQYTASTTGDYHVIVTTANGCNFTSNTVTITAGSDPTANISAASNDICPGETSTLSTSPSAGETVQWLESGNPIAGETGNTYVASTAGDYSVEITNSAGCSSVSTVETIVVNPVPNPSITGSEPNFCPGITTITLTAAPSAASSYQWYQNGNPIAGATNMTFDATSDGDYTVEVTNAQGCSATSPITTLQTGTVSSFTVTPDVTSFCDGESVNLSTTLESGSTYQWFLNGNPLGSASVNQNTISSSNGGDFYVEVTTDLGCSTTSNTVTVTENPLPTANISTSNSSYCPGDSTLITANSITGATYEWFFNGSSLGTGTNSIYATSQGDYWVEVTDNCTGTSNTLTITEQSAPANAGTISGTTSFCPGASLNFSISSVANASSYNWEIVPASAGSIGSGQGTASVTVNTTNQNFTISVTPENNCSVGGQSNLAVSLEPSFMCQGQVLFAANPTNVCEGSQVTYTNYTDNSIFIGATPEWNFGTGASPATASGNGPHTVTYSTSGLKTVTLEYVDNFGFTIASETKTDYVNVNGSVNTSAITGNTSLDCNGGIEQYSVTNTTGSSYNWTVPNGSTILTGQGSNTIQVDMTSGGDIEVVETTVAGCVGAPVTLTVSVSNGPVTSSITGNNIVECNTSSEIYSVTNTPGSNYQWSVPAGANIVSGQNTNQIEVDFMGNFGTISVVEEDATGCQGQTVTLDVACNVGIKNETNTQIKLYPNPTFDYFRLQGLESGLQYQLTIYNVNGKIVMSKGITENQQIDITSFASGVYYCQLQSKNEIINLRLIKQN